MLVTLGKRRESTGGSISEEHFSGAFMRNKPGARLHHRNKKSGGKKLLVCCLPGEHHEVGVMPFSLAGHDHGYRIVYPGPDMPLRELALTARHAGCDAIVLSGSVTPREDLLTRELPWLVSHADSPVFMGGTTSVRCAGAIERAGALEPAYVNVTRDDFDGNPATRRINQAQHRHNTKEKPREQL